MKVLIACEFSGIVRDAFLAKGHDAVSCDLLPTEQPGPHIQGDVLNILDDGWDLMIGHPPCFFMANSGVRWLFHPDDVHKPLDERRDHPRFPGRRADLKKARDFFLALWNAPIPHIALENPIPHKYAQLPPYTQVIQPWQFGHPETKATCLWLKNLPEIQPTNIVKGRKGRVWLESPGPDRWKRRSVTYPGIAQSFADQWNTLP